MAVGDSGVGLAAISRRNLEPVAEGRTADTRKADALVAVTRHPKKNPGLSSGLRFPFELIPAANRQNLLFTLPGGEISEGVGHPLALLRRELGENRDTEHLGGKLLGDLDAVGAAIGLG